MGPYKRVYVVHENNSAVSGIFETMWPAERAWASPQWFTNFHLTQAHYCYYLRYYGLFLHAKVSTSWKGGDGYTYSICKVRTQYTQSKPSMNRPTYAGYVQNMKSIHKYITRTVYMQYVYSVKTVCLQYMHNIWILYVQYTNSICTVHEKCMYSVFTVYEYCIQCMYRIRTTYVQYMPSIIMFAMSTAHNPAGLTSS
jgi:hypothetical protein